VGLFRGCSLAAFVFSEKGKERLEGELSLSLNNYFAKIYLRGIKGAKLRETQGVGKLWRVEESVSQWSTSINAITRGRKPREVFCSRGSGEFWRRGGRVLPARTLGTLRSGSPRGKPDGQCLDALNALKTHAAALGFRKTLEFPLRVRERGKWCNASDVSPAPGKGKPRTRRPGGEREKGDSLIPERGFLAGSQRTIDRCRLRKRISWGGREIKKKLGQLSRTVWAIGGCQRREKSQR